MFRNIFNPDNALMITFSQISDCIFLSLLWILCCFPVISTGASCAALYASVYHSFRQGDKNSWGRFFKAFKDNLKASILPTVVFLALLLLLLKGLVAAWNAAVYGLLSWALFAAIALVGILALGVLGLIFPVLSRFENSFVGLMKNTVFLAMANLPKTLVLGLLYAVGIFLCLRFVFPLFFLPALISLISTVMIEKMFKPFLPGEENE